MTNEKLVELIDNQLQTQMVKVKPTPKYSTYQFCVQGMIEETIVNRRIVSSIYFIA
jgi:hypothetical protein